MSTHKRQLRLLAPKLPGHLVSPVQQRLQLEHNIWDERDTEGHMAATANAKLQLLASSQSYIPSVPSRHGFTLSPLHPPLTSADNCLPELVGENLLSGTPVVTSESHDFSTQHLPYGNLQFQETLQNRQVQDYWIPMLHAPEDAVWAAMAQPTIGTHPDQSPQPISDQYPSVSTQQIPSVQIAYHASFQQNLQYGACSNCPSVWRSHLESIMYSDLEYKGLSNLKRSYRQLEQHIHMAHQPHYEGAACASCENLFCYHLEKMMLLETTKGDLCEVKIDLQRSFTALRDHIKEAHGGC